MFINLDFVGRLSLFCFVLIADKMHGRKLLRAGKIRRGLIDYCKVRLDYMVRAGSKKIN